MRAVRVWCAAVLLLVAGCDGGTGVLIVQLRSDLVPVRDFVAVTVAVTDSAGSTIERRFEVGSERGFGRGVRVAELGDLPLGATRLVLSARDDADAVVVERPARLELAEGTRVLTILLTRDCQGVSCPLTGDDAGDIACVAGRCVPEGCSEDDPTECAPRECETSATCSAPAAMCASAECTPSGSCFEVTNDGDCSGGTVCDPDVGCVDIGGGLDAGPGADAAVDAGACTAPVCQLEAPQCGCPEPLACFAVTAVDRECEAPGTGAVGDSCTVQTECAARNVCVTLLDDGTCQAACDETSDCVGAFGCFHADELGTGVCLGRSCDPRMGSGCTSGACGLVFRAPVDTGASVAHECRAAGTVAQDDPCTRRDDCESGLVCTDGVGGTTCRAYCADLFDCVGSRECLELAGSTGLGICSSACDPLAGTGCTAGLDCALVTVTQRGSGMPLRVPVCGNMGTGGPVASCSTTADCRPGHTCETIGGGPRQCHELCDIAASGSCLSTGSCTVFPSPTPTSIGFNLGYCG